MRFFKTFVVVVLLLLVSVFVCGCKLEHSYFEFVLEDFAGLQEEEYTTSTELKEYTISDIVIRPWVKESPHNVYGIGIYGYTDKQPQNTELKINSLTLCTNNAVELVSITDGDIEFQCLENDSYTCFIADNIGDFAGDVDTIKSYDTLYLKLVVSVTDGECVETQEIRYKIKIIEYLSWFMIT
jgi:hypothetical protein